MKCCIHHVLPSGHVIPFCAYNVLYRDGHVPLPPLAQRARPQAAESTPQAAENAGPEKTAPQFAAASEGGTG